MIRFTSHAGHLAAAFLFAALSPLASHAADNPTPVAPKDFLQGNMDSSIDPGKDFFEYANGGWLARNPIPASESAWSIGNVVDEQLYVSLRGINEKAAQTDNPPGSDQQKIGDFWTTAMDTAKADQLGVHPLDAELKRIDAVRNTRDALDVAFALQPLLVNAFFSVDVHQDEKSSDTMAVHLSQGGLGLPERDFYFNPEKGVAKIRAEYVAHIARTLVLLGRDAAHAKADAAHVMALETALAKTSRKLEDLRDPQKNYNKMTPAEVTAKDTPSIVWSERLAAWNLHPDNIVVGQPEYLAALDKLLKGTPAPVLRDYLRYHLVDTYAPFLSQPFDLEHFQFHGQVLSG